MNAQDIWSGNEYALFEGKGRNENFRLHADRVRVLRVYKQRAYYNERASTLVDVQMLDGEGNLLQDYNGATRTRTVRARDIAMLWENYEQERDYRLREQAHKESERQQALQQEQGRKDVIRTALERRKSIPSEWIYNITIEGVHLSSTKIEQWIKEDDG